MMRTKEWRSVSRRLKMGIGEWKVRWRRVIDVFSCERKSYSSISDSMGVNTLVYPGDLNRQGE